MFHIVRTDISLHTCTICPERVCYKERCEDYKRLIASRKWKERQHSDYLFGIFQLFFVLLAIMLSLL